MLQYPPLDDDDDDDDAKMTGERVGYKWRRWRRVVLIQLSPSLSLSLSLTLERMRRETEFAVGRNLTPPNFSRPIPALHLAPTGVLLCEK